MKQLIVYNLLFLFAFIQPVAAIEDMVVVAQQRCGPWPIDHEVSRNCEYPELRRAQLDVIDLLRPQLWQRCLDCRDGGCVPRFPGGEAGRTCRLVFLTPRQVLPVRFYMRDARPLEARFTYTIDARGRVSELSLTDSSGLNPGRLQRLLKSGASYARYEPLVIDGRAYEVRGVEGIYRSP